MWGCEAERCWWRGLSDSKTGDGARPRGGVIHVTMPRRAGGRGLAGSPGQALPPGRGRSPGRLSPSMCPGARVLSFPRAGGRSLSPSPGRAVSFMGRGGCSPSFTLSPSITPPLPLSPSRGLRAWKSPAGAVAGAGLLVSGAGAWGGGQRVAALP